MCGIAGIWGQADEILVRRMMGRLVHRGPDAQGLFTDGRGALGHRRLSIMDPQGGNQPIFDETRRRAIVANGEIYNFPVLRKMLEGRHRFLTRSDTESALHLYEELGKAVVGRLDGMFAFAIADDRDLFLARDPIGIKPLYHGRKNGAMVFASELKALAGVAEDVREFPPGTWYHSRMGFRPYYVVPNRSHREMPLRLRLRILRESLERAITKRLMSDVPLGAFLSGGLDSSLIAAVARRRLGALHTFSVGLEGSSDLEAARRIARHLDTEHHEYVFTVDEVREKLPEILFHLESYDRDLVRSAIPCYFVSRMASEHVKVVLTGEGADELFGGYSYYKKIHQPDTLRRELRRSVSSLHNINLQRVDRLTMAHSIEARVPFLDVEMIETAQTVPPDLKLRPKNGGPAVEKWILRKACEDLLPADILWRKKEQFDEGSGTVAALDRLLEDAPDSEQAVEYARRHPEAGLRSPEECLYHRLLTEGFPDDGRVLHDNVGRWSERPRGIPGGRDGTSG
jgi:asparagine synthase (glutamine-hydrolysing)